VLWYAADDLDFSAAQDVRFGLLALIPGVVVGIALTAWSARPRPLARAAWWGAGALAGSGAMWLTGLAASGALTMHPRFGETARVPVVLSSPGMALAWPLLVFLIPAVVLAVQALFTPERVPARPEV
jgi:hypothetical protein